MACATAEEAEESDDAADEDDDGDDPRADDEEDEDDGDGKAGSDEDDDSAGNDANTRKDAGPRKDAGSSKADAGGEGRRPQTAVRVDAAIPAAGAPTTPAAPATAGCGGLSLPPVTDYGAKGPFDTEVVNNTGPDGMYTIYKPKTLGADGFKHPPATWGNGITTTPSLYPGLLGGIASHGFVIVASNSSNVNTRLMTAGLDWLIEQNDASGPYQGKLSVDCAVSIGYSLGGGAAVDTGKHKSVVATVSFHGLQGTAELLHGPLLLMTGTGDDFVSAAAFVTPTFNRSKVQTFYGTLTDATHLKPVGDAGEQRAPAIAWLRLWVYGDEGGRKYFYGDDCLLCKAPWVMPQRKNWP